MNNEKYLTFFVSGMPQTPSEPVKWTLVPDFGHWPKDHTLYSCHRIERKPAPPPEIVAKQEKNKRIKTEKQFLICALFYLHLSSS